MANVSQVWTRTGCLYRAGYLTPYLAETIADDVRRTPGTRARVRLSADADESEVGRLQRRLAGLLADVRLRRPAGSRRTTPAQRASRRS